MHGVILSFIISKKNKLKNNSLSTRLRKPVDHCIGPLFAIDPLKLVAIFLAPSTLSPFPIRSKASDYARHIATMDFSNLKESVANLTLYDLKAGVRKVQNGE